MIEFRRETKTARLHDPRKGFELAEIESEVRYDPLTGRSARICHFSLGKTPPPAELQAMAQSTREQCPFCPERVQLVTPRFPEDLIRGGRLSRGGATVFPNLFPYDDISAVAVMCGEHFLPMQAMPEQPIVDGLTAARDFIAAVSTRLADRAAYGLVNWNYMPPAGASQVHPHMQVVVTSSPGNALSRELAAEQEYQRRCGRTYAADLLAAEKGGARWIGASGSACWFAPFAPSGVRGDCCALFPGRATYTELTDADIADFVAGLTRILKSFAAAGLWSFNLSFFPEAFGARGDRHWLSARLLPRFYLNPLLHVTDVACLHLHLEERFAMVSPEETAAMLRQEFGQ